MELSEETKQIEYEHRFELWVWLQRIERKINPRRRNQWGNFSSTKNWFENRWPCTIRYRFFEYYDTFMLSRNWSFESSLWKRHYWVIEHRQIDRNAINFIFTKLK